MRIRKVSEAEVQDLKWDRSIGPSGVDWFLVKTLNGELDPWQPYQ